MKSRTVAVFMVVLGLALAVPASAQTVGLGFKGGLNLADLLGEDSNGADTRATFHGGGYIAYMVSESFHLQLEGIYTERGAEFRSENGRVPLETAYIEVPLLAKYRFPARRDAEGALPYLLAGPAVSFEVKCDFGVPLSNGTVAVRDCDDPSVNFATESLEWGAIFGGGLEVAAGSAAILLEGRFHIGLSSIDDAPERADIRSATFSLSAGVGIPLG